MAADGELHQVTAASEPDLFWALRGGKGNFGVVTSLEFSLFPVRRFYGGGPFFAGERAAEVVHTWRDWVVDLPGEMTSSIAFLRRPALPGVPEPLRGTFVMHVRFSSLRHRDRAERALTPIRRIGPTILDTITERPYREAEVLHLDPPATVPWVERSAALQDFPAEAARRHPRAVGPDSGTRLGFVELRSAARSNGRPRYRMRSPAEAPAGHSSAPAPT